MARPSCLDEKWAVNAMVSFRHHSVTILGMGRVSSSIDKDHDLARLGPLYVRAARR